MVVEFCCRRMERAAAEPMVPIVFDPETHTVVLKDSSIGAWAPINFCPFCGKKIRDAKSPGPVLNSVINQELQAKLAAIRTTAEMRQVFGEPDDINCSQPVAPRVTWRAQYSYYSVIPDHDLFFQESTSGSVDVIAAPSQRQKQKAIAPQDHS